MNRFRWRVFDGRVLGDIRETVWRPAMRKKVLNPLWLRWKSHI